MYLHNKKKLLRIKALFHLGLGLFKIHCKACELVYIGETGRDFDTPIN